MSAPPTGVGIVGCGSAAQAIHLPTLSTLPDRFRIVHVTDVDAGLGREVAARCGARFSDALSPLLADPAVEVVAICSPHALHAEHVEAACALGKRAVLCEKPLATSDAEAERIIVASTHTGTPVAVGTMHAYDPAVRAALDAWDDDARFVRSTISLSPNERFIDAATELHAQPPPLPTFDGEPTLEQIAARFTGAILGLATHDLPLVRHFAPTIDAVGAARLLRPVGYEIVFTSGEATVQLLAAVHPHWHLDWRLDVWGREQELRLEFPPSYVLAGSARATISAHGVSRQWQLAENGYQAEWAHIADVVREGAPPAVTVEGAADDLRFALELISGCVRRAAEPR